MEPQMPYDDVAWEQSEYISDNWLRQFLDDDFKKPIARFITHYDSDGSVLPEFAIFKKGSYNIILRLKFEYRSTDIRFPQPGAVFFPAEKVTNEVAVMRYLSDQMSMPVPFIYHWGLEVYSRLGLGPFIIMNHIDYTTSMYDALNTPGCPKEVRGVLDPNIQEEQLETLYKQLAKILLQLSMPDFPKIGSLNQVDDFTWEVTRRPLSVNMNELVRLGTLPRSALSPLDATFETASSYIETLAQLNIKHLHHQRNDAVNSADDCRRKYIARQLFYKLAKEKKLLSLPCYNENGPFKLWCDDFRPANVLLNEDLQIAGVVDWEFTYAAPVAFTYAPPWWLLIERPDNWSAGLDDWTAVFDRRLKTFLTAMRHCEDTDTDVQHGHQPRLSDQMQQSWESGDFWVVYALLNSFAFDAIYWQKIDRRFFGPTETDDPSEAWKERLHLLDETQKSEMERLVTRKLEEMEDRALAWDPDEATEEFQQELKRKRAKEAEEQATEASS